MQSTIEKLVELQSAAGANKKKEILQKYKDDEDFCRHLYYILNPMLTYKVSAQTLQRPPTEVCSGWNNIYEVCEDLSKMSALDNHTINRVCKFLEGVVVAQIADAVFNGSEHSVSASEFYAKLLSKTLRLGVTAKTVNKVIPGLIPEWEVQQAYPIDKYPIPEGTWFTLTQKLNGVRATWYKGKLYARSGIPYEGLDHITRILSHEYFEDYVFDGELTLIDKGSLSDNEAFRKSTGIINSDDTDKTAIGYTIFDVLTEEEFDQEESGSSYRMRRNLLNVLAYKFFNDNAVRVLPVLYQGTDQSKIDELLDQMVVEDKEGLMVNLDVPYQRKRHRGILKVKRFYTMDLPILECEEGSGRLAGTLGAFVLDYKGNPVNVGSGFSDDQRTDFWNRRNDLPGTLCEVKYKEISRDKKTGTESLQFPIFVSLRPDKTEPSFG